MLMTTEFSLQLNKPTLPGNQSLLLAYVRFVKDGSLCQELLFACLLETDTNGDSVYQAVEDYFKKKSIPRTNIFSCATDGAPSMVGHHFGFLSYLKKAFPQVPKIHCVINRQHLVARNLSEKFHEFLSTVLQSTKSKRMVSILDCSIGCVLKMTKIFNVCFIIQNQVVVDR